MGGPLATAGIGLLSGVLSGWFGIGGGLVTTPAIRLLLGYPALIAVGTPLPVILPTAVAGAFAHARAGQVDMRAGLTIGAAGALTSLVGAWLSSVAGGTSVMVLTAAFIVWAAGDMVVQAYAAPARAGREAVETLAGDGRDDSASARSRTLVLIGLAAGLYSGFLGLGGGFVIVPALTRFLSFPIKRAVGTSLVCVAVLAVPGSVAHYLLGHIDPVLALGLIAGTVPGALAGARLTRAASDRALRIGFAVVLVFTGLVLAASELGVLPR